MSENLWVSETFTNVTENYSFGSSDPYETGSVKVGDLFRDLQREYGGCVSRTYVDTDEGTVVVGWYFQKWMQYEGVRPRGACCYDREGQSGYGTPYSPNYYCRCCGRWTKATDIWYKRGVWVTVYRGNPHQVTRTVLETPVYALAGHD